MRQIVFSLMCIVIVSIVIDFNAAADVFPIRVYCIIPKGEKLDEKSLQRIGRSFPAARDFFSAELERHSFGEKTFDLPAADDGTIVVNTIEAHKTLKEHKTADDYLAYVPKDFNSHERISVFFIVGTEKAVNKDQVGFASLNCGGEGCGHLIFVPLGNEKALSAILAHELAHGCGIYHVEEDSSQPNDLLMRTKPPTTWMDVHKLKDFSITYREARWLNFSRHFNGWREIESFPSVEKFANPEGVFRDGEAYVKLSFEVSSDDPLRQADLYVTSGNFLAWDELEGCNDTAVFFVSRKDLEKVEKIRFQVINSVGGIKRIDVDLNMPDFPEDALKPNILPTRWVGFRETQ